MPQNSGVGFKSEYNMSVIC